MSMIWGAATGCGEMGKVESLGRSFCGRIEFLQPRHRRGAKSRVHAGPTCPTPSTRPSDPAGPLQNDCSPEDGNCLESDSSLDSSRFGADAPAAMALYVARHLGNFGSFSSSQEPDVVKVFLCIYRVQLSSLLAGMILLLSSTFSRCDENHRRKRIYSSQRNAN